MNKHTPGPWFYETGNTEALIVERDGTTVAELQTTYQTTAHRSLEANARLIAAAPDLLAALKGILREHDALQMAEGRTGDRWPAATRTRAAITKATGEA